VATFSVFAIWGVDFVQGTIMDERSERTEHCVLIDY